MSITMRMVTVVARPKVVVLSTGRLDFDGKVDWSPLSKKLNLVKAEATTRDDIVSQAKGAAALITKELAMDRGCIMELPESVRIICEAGTGFNNIDVEAARERGIAVCNVPEYSTEAVAHLVVTYILNLSCSFTQHWADQLPPMVEVQGKTLGLIGGSGAIGKRVADIATCLGMRVLTYSRRSSDTSLDDVLTQSDFISIHCPLTPETHHLIDRDALAKMKPTAFLINTARGAIIKEIDLVDALEKNRIAGAGLDVQDPEPPSPNSPLFRLPNVLLTPHIGWRRIETRNRLITLVADNLKACFSSQEEEKLPPNLVN